MDTLQSKQGGSRLTQLAVGVGVGDDVGVGVAGLGDGVGEGVADVHWVNLNFPIFVRQLNPLIV
jgi:hypothetical protein